LIHGNRMPRITIIETGQLGPRYRERHGSFPEMFERLIGAEDASIGFDVVGIPNGEPLPDPAKLQAILITGSPAGVYDELDWIAPLEDFVRAADSNGRRLLRPSADRTGDGRRGPQIGPGLGHRATCLSGG
jgi:GMP synthase-like glutamine amidotransferase